MFRVLFILFSMKLCFVLQSQEPEVDLIENNIQNTESEFENENIIEDLQNLSLNPVNVNDSLTDYSGLIQYSIISPLQAKNISDYTSRYGAFITKNELIAVPGLSLENVQNLMPYITVNEVKIEPPTLLEQFRWSRKNLFMRSQFLLEEQKGFIEDSTGTKKYLGNRPKIYLKYRQQFQDILSIGFQADKDPGEEFFSGNNKSGFDFYSAHFAFRPKSRLLNQIIVGDYEIKIGQGLIQWNGFSLGKGSNATNVFLKSPVQRPYTSSNEYNFLRGVSTELQLTKNISANIWLSQKNIDGNREIIDTLNPEGQLSSIQISGLHRTLSEIENKNTSSEFLAGTNLAFENDWLKLGFTAQHSKLSDSVSYRNQPYQKFFPTGKIFQNLGLHYSAIRKNFYFFGEAAVNQDFAFATIHGLQHFFGSGVKGTLVYRNYAKNYRNFYASAMGENTSTNNEEGVYFGLEYSPVKNVTFETYADFFRFPWKKFRVSKPSNGNEFFLRTIYQPRDEIQLELRSRLETKEIDISGNTLPQKLLTEQKRYNNRLELRFRPTEFWYFKSRFGHSFYETSADKEHGYLLFQDAIYEIPSKKAKFYTRLALFHTPSYNSRLYAYENDLLYSFSVPAYYGKGVRYYAMASLEPFGRLKFWLKASQTAFSDRETISSGNNEIAGNTRTDLKFQLQWKF